MRRVLCCAPWKPEDSDRRSVGNSLASGCPTTVAGVAMAGVLISKPATILFTVYGGSTPWAAKSAPGCKISGSGVHITVISNVRGDVETVLDTFPGLHFPVTRSTAGADGSCQLSDRAVLLVGPSGGLLCCRTTCRMSRAPNTAGKSSSDRTSSELTRVTTSSDIHTIVTAKSSHFLTSSDSSFEDDASKLRYTDENDVWSFKQRESSPPARLDLARCRRRRQFRRNRPRQMDLTGPLRHRESR